MGFHRTLNTAAGNKNCSRFLSRIVVFIVKEKVSLESEMVFMFDETFLSITHARIREKSLLRFLLPTGVLSMLSTLYEAHISLIGSW